jgi:hypothetical protein
MSHDTLIAGLVAAAPLLLIAAYWSYRRSIAARRCQAASGEATPEASSGSARPIPLWAVLAALALFAIVVLFLIDTHVARGLLVALVPFVIFFAFWMFMIRRTTRPPSTAPPESPPGRPAVTQRSRRMALLPIAVVLGISAIVRALIGH